MVKVIEEEGEECSHDTSLVFPHLERLTLYELPKLKTFCKYALGLLKLVEVNIYSCPEMVWFGSLSTSYPKSLESFEIRSCSKMETLFLWSKEESIEQTITLPNLTTLCLSDLPQLRNIYEGVESIEFPFPTPMEIKNCPNLQESLVCARTLPSFGDIDNRVSFGIMRKQEVKGHTNFVSVWCSQISSGSFTHLEELVIRNIGIKSLFPVSMAQNLESLKLLRIESCKEMVKVIEEEEGEEEHSHDTSLLFPHLKELTLEELPKLKTFCKYALGLPELVHMVIWDCPEMVRFNLGSLSTSYLKSLESLEIEDCSMMKQVFLWSEEESIGQTITLPKLTTLKLCNLPRLRNMCKGVESIEFHLLADMEIEDCPNLKSLVSATTCSSSGDINKVVVEPKEQTLVSYSNSFSIWDQISIRSFTTLENLDVYGCHEISSLFSSPIAAALINLEILRIKRCKNMTKVIEGDDQTTPLFPHLEILCFERLPELKIFCEWRCALELPSLRSMYIVNGCPKLERFSLRSLTAPNLEIFEVDDIDVAISGDLNHVLQQHFINREESTSSKGKIMEEEEPTLNDSQEVKDKTEEIHKKLVIRESELWKQ